MVIRPRLVKARSKHICTRCRKIIQENEYCWVRGVDYYCEKCKKIIEKGESVFY